MASSFYSTLDTLFGSYELIIRECREQSCSSTELLHRVIRIHNEIATWLHQRRHIRSMHSASERRGGFFSLHLYWNLYWWYITIRCNIPSNEEIEVWPVYFIKVFRDSLPRLPSLTLRDFDIRNETVLFENVKHFKSILCSREQLRDSLFRELSLFMWNII